MHVRREHNDSIHPLSNVCFSYVVLFNHISYNISLSNKLRSIYFINFGFYNNSDNCTIDISKYHFRKGNRDKVL